jgi:hypothetical protein
LSAATVIFAVMAAPLKAAVAAESLRKDRLAMPGFMVIRAPLDEPCGAVRSFFLAIGYLQNKEK